MRFGIIGGGSWATALAKILTDRKHSINWWIRNAGIIEHIQEQGYNPNYLSTAKFDTSFLSLATDIAEVVKRSDVLIIAVPSAFAEESLSILKTEQWKGKKVVSA